MTNWNAIMKRADETLSGEAAHLIGDLVEDIADPVGENECLTIGDLLAALDGKKEEAALEAQTFLENEAAKNANTPEFFVSQWGYEQTNVDFYRVEKRTEKMVTLVQVESSRDYLDGVNYEAIPCDEPLSRAKTIRRKLLKWGEKEAVKLNGYTYARKWDGRPVGGSSGY